MEPAAEAEAIAPAVVDFHNHLIPGVDDGAADIGESRAALAAMVAEGVTGIITTPHVEALAGPAARLVGGRLDVMDGPWAALEELVRSGFPQLSVHRGAEVRLDAPDPDLSDPRLRLAGGRFVLVEFAYFTVPPRSARVLANIRHNGWTPIVAHPERYRSVEGDAAVVDEWRDAGALIQVNGGSLLGRYGAGPRRTAARLLERGVADYVSSDYHARGSPQVARYRSALISGGGAVQCELLLETNPARILNGEDPLPVPPLQHRRGLLSWLTEVLK